MFAGAHARRVLACPTLSAVTVPAELRTSLPSSIAIDEVRAAVRSPGSPDSLGGETWLLDVDGKLAVLVRSSIFDPLEPIALAHPVELRERNELEIRPTDREPFIVRPSPFERDAIAELLATVDGVASLSKPEPTTQPNQPAIEPIGEPITLTDLDSIDPELEVEVVAALEAGEYDRVLAAARALAQQSRPRERDCWHDLIELLTPLRANDWTAAYLLTRGVRQVPTEIADALFATLSDVLERRDQLVLAWAAAGELLLDESGPERRARLEARLDRDEPTLTREVASQARDFFSGPAAAGDRLAQRGLAGALLELDQLDEALTWIRRAIAAERFDFEARMLEAQILSLQAIERQDPRELTATLLKISDDFHDRPEPLVVLADQVEFDDPAWAIDCLREAQQREFDEFVLLSLIELLESVGRHDELLREIEQALANPDSVVLVANQLHHKQRAALAVLQGQPPVAARPQPPAARPVVLVAAILAIAIAATLILLL